MRAKRDVLRRDRWRHGEQLWYRGKSIQSTNTLVHTYYLYRQTMVNMQALRTALWRAGKVRMNGTKSYLFAFRV